MFHCYPLPIHHQPSPIKTVIIHFLKFLCTLLVISRAQVLVPKGLLFEYTPETICFAVMHQSNPSANIPPGKSPGNFLRWSKALPRGKIFLQKHGPRGKKTPTPGEYFRRSSQPFLLTGDEILGFFRNQRLKRIERLSYYSLVIPSSFSLSTILKVLKFSPSFETYFVTRE